MPLFIVDAFADRPFSGNPAAICLLKDPVEADWMQALASEMNLSETAFVRRLDSGFELRWFTPAYEVELCGHATLASAHILWTQGVVPVGEAIAFHTRSGELTCGQEGDVITLDFPARPPTPGDPPAGLTEALGAEGEYAGRTGSDDHLVMLPTENAVRDLSPNFHQLGQIAARGFIVTSQSDAPEYDFISRFFAPSAGVNEDPVTGSAHCALAPFWFPRLGKTELTGFQASQRGGVVSMKVQGDRVQLGGKAITMLSGELHTP